MFHKVVITGSTSMLNELPCYIRSYFQAFKIQLIFVPCTGYRNNWLRYFMEMTSD
uniref:Uncharacterized protein n=1 Tax=Rhizophora mucronata TaxID=61149 RepID=A0A2P2J1X1_RHIMU